jgi:hypothetical protein
MAQFRLKEQQPSRGKLHGTKGHAGVVKEIRLHLHDGSTMSVKPSLAKSALTHSDTFEVTDERAIRHLTIDPRFELVQE